MGSRRSNINYIQKNIQKIKRKEDKISLVTFISKDIGMDNIEQVSSGIAILYKNMSDMTLESFANELRDMVRSDIVDLSI